MSRNGPVKFLDVLSLGHGGRTMIVVTLKWVSPTIAIGFLYGQGKL